MSEAQQGTENSDLPSEANPSMQATAGTSSSASPDIVSSPIRRTLFILAIPVLGEQLLNAAVGTFDVFLAGRLNHTATSAIGLGAYVVWLGSMIAMLVGTGTTALVSRFEGAGDHEQANRFANQSITLSAIVGLGIFLFMFTLAPWFAHYCRMTGEAYTITVHYLRFDAIGLFFLCITLVGSAALRGLGNMRTPMIIFTAINLTNMLVSYLLVYGPGPIPRLGVTGIVVGTVAAHSLGAILMVTVLARGKTGIHIQIPLLKLRMPDVKRILNIGTPAAADGMIMWSGHFVFLAIISRLAAPQESQILFAAHIVAIRVEALTYLPAVAWSTATATMIGQALGAANIARARCIAHEAVFQCGLLSLATAAFFYFGADLIYDVMSTDEKVRLVGAPPFRYLSLLQPLLVVAIVYIWALRGSGDTKYPLLITIVGVNIRILTGYVCGIVLEGGLLGAWMGMFADNIWRGAAGLTRYCRGKWVHTKV